jgi:WD40 repeat protein
MNQSGESMSLSARSTYVKRVGLTVAALTVGVLLATDWFCVDLFAQATSTEDGQSAKRPAVAQESNEADPFLLMWQRAVDALDESYDQWNFRPTETVDSTTFTINYIASLATDGRRRLDRVMILHADPNRDRSVTRDEAVSFLESQIGLKWITGDALRLDDGRVLAFSDFLRADTDQDDRVSQKEFVVAMWDRIGADADFSRLDVNEDGWVDLEEYAQLNGPNYRDVLGDFSEADRDRDRSLSRDELLNFVPLHRRHLVDTNLVAFDDDGDKVLSIAEYRLSMLANYNYPWELMPKDDDLDGQISFDEFQFHPRDLFQLQKRYYFHQLDLDHDGLLSDDEFVFQPQQNHSLISLDSRGEHVRQIFKTQKYPRVGSPAVRAGGGDLLFHAIPAEGEHQAVLILLAVDGSESREITHGLMPSWSPAGDRFTCSRYDGGASVWIGGLDGNVRKRIDDGWGAEWSPDGRWIAYRNDNGIRLYDVRQDETIPFLDKSRHSYRYIHPFLTWSPTGRQFAFFGETDRETELAVVSIDRLLQVDGDSDSVIEGGVPSVKTLFRTPEKVNGEMVWTQGGEFLFSMFSQSKGRTVVYSLNPSLGDKPVALDALSGLINPVDLTLIGGGSGFVATVSN